MYFGIVKTITLNIPSAGNSYWFNR